MISITVENPPKIDLGAPFAQLTSGANSEAVGALLGVLPSQVVPINYKSTSWLTIGNFSQYLFVKDSRFSTVICAPVYSSGEGLATQVAAGPEEGLKHASWIMCDNLVSLRKSDLTHYVGSLRAAEPTEVNRALKLALDLI